jgi:hypothetical protein
MSDEEWDMRIAQIIESGDVELLVALWGKLCTDVHKWLDCRPIALSGKGVQWRKPSTAPSLNGLQEQDPESTEGPTSSVHMMTAATLAAIDAIAEGQQETDCNIKVIDLSSQQHILSFSTHYHYFNL